MSTFSEICDRVQESKLFPGMDSKYTLEKDREYLISFAEEILAENELLRYLINLQVG